MGVGGVRGDEDGLPPLRVSRGVALLNAYQHGLASGSASAAAEEFLFLAPVKRSEVKTPIPTRLQSMPSCTEPPRPTCTSTSFFRCGDGLCDAPRACRCLGQLREGLLGLHPERYYPTLLTIYIGPTRVPHSVVLCRLSLEDPRPWTTCLLAHSSFYLVPVPIGHAPRYSSLQRSDASLQTTRLRERR